LITILGLLMLRENGQAQTQKIDSLSSLLSGSKGEQRFEILYNLGYEFIDIDNQEALNYADDAYQFAASFGDSLKMVKATRIKGSALRRMERISEAIDVSRTALVIARRNNYKEEVKILLNAIAIAYSLKAEYDKALEYHFQSLIVREREGNKAEISITRNNIGFVYFKLKNYDMAIENFNKALELKKQVNDTHDLDRLLINIGLSYNHLRNFDLALKFINEGLQACGKNCNDQIVIEGKFGLGVSYFNLQQLEKSETELNQALDLARKSDSKRWQAESLVYLAKLSIIKNKADSANKYLQETERLALQAGYNQLLMDAYKQFSLLYTQIKDFEKASSYQEKYIQLKDSLISEDLIKNIAKIQTSFEERENIATIASKEEVIEQQQKLTVAVVAIALLTGLLVLVLQRSNRTIKKVNVQLSEAKEVIQEQNVLLESKNRYLDKEVEKKTEALERANQSLKQVNDELDNFIYKTSHDIRGPLASLKGMCNVALMDVKDPVALDYLRKLDATAERLNTILTRLLIINQINNSKLSLSKVDFPSIVKDVLLLEKKKGLPQKLTITKHIDEEVFIQSDRELIRIVLENLIDNAIKFYNDSERVDSFVEIKVSGEPEGYVKVRVVDNGIGISEANPGKLFRMFFRASERSETGGIGLYIVKTATAKLGGKVGLLTTPEGHTEFFVVFPPVPPNPDDGPEKPSLY